MLSSNPDDNNHLFCYVWVLGVFPANVIYTGPGSLEDGVLMGTMAGNFTQLICSSQMEETRA